MPLITNPRPATQFGYKTYGGAVGDGVADDTAAIQRAHDAAAALTPPGTVVASPGVYKVTNYVTLAANLVDEGAKIVYSGGTTNPAWTIGSATPNTVRDLICDIPWIQRSTRSWGTVGTADVGVRILNVGASLFRVRRIEAFTSGLQIAGQGGGCSYNNFLLDYLYNNKANLHLTTMDDTGWANENTFIGGRLDHDSGIGTAVSGVRHILIDANASTSGPGAANNCLFLRQSVEGNVPEYHVECKGGSWNVFQQLRWEATTPKIFFSQYSATLYSLKNVVRDGYNADLVVLTESANSQKNLLLPYSGWKLTSGAGSYAIAAEHHGADTSSIFNSVAAGTINTADPATAYGFSLRHAYIALKREGDAADRIRLDAVNGRFGFGDGTTVNQLLVDRSSRSGVFTLASSGGFQVGGTGGPVWTSGTGTPEGVVTGNVGDCFSRTNGGAGTSLYVKESGTGNTGWIGK